MSIVIIAVVSILTGFIIGFILGEMNYYNMHKTMVVSKEDELKEKIQKQDDIIKFLQIELVSERRSKINVPIKEATVYESDTAEF